MAKGKPNLDNYVEVNERIEKFYEKYPEGSLQSEILDSPEGIIVVKAFAYRNYDDTCPGVGHASEPVPGKTPYTKDSELMNAETSAWGRALAALGFEVKRAIASQEEVRNRSEAENVQSDPAAERGEKIRKASESLAGDHSDELVNNVNKSYAKLVDALGKDEAAKLVKMKLAEVGVNELAEMTAVQAEGFYTFLQSSIPSS